MVNANEAKVVKFICKHYLRLESVKGLMSLLEERSIKSKRRISQIGNQSGGMKSSELIRNAGKHPRLLTITALGGHGAR